MTIAPTQNVIIYSLPGEPEFKLCHQNDFGVSQQLEEGLSYFVVRPFNSGQPTSYIRADVHHSVDVNQLVVSSWPKTPSSESTSQAEYEKLINKAIKQSSAINGKIIASRVDEVQVRGLRLAESLNNLKSKFPNSFIYFLVSDTYGMWLGATPETLVQKEGDLVSTMALAGTKWGGDLFTQKEFDEQMLVTKDIMDRLADEVIEVGDVHEMSYGELRHLRTNIRWQSEESILKFAELLHPTSAVSGFPRKEALDFITENEKHGRSLYTGYLGLVDSNNSKLFVNLRCMRLFEDQVRVHVGGGINEKSDPKSEWEETVRKSNSVKEALAHG